MNSDEKSILVTGDVVVDRHLYHGNCKNSYEIRKKPGSFFKEEFGGARLFRKFLEKITGHGISFGLQEEINGKLIYYRPKVSHAVLK